MPKFRVTRVDSVVVEADDKEEAKAVGEEIFDSAFLLTYSDFQVEELESSE